MDSYGSDKDAVEVYTSFGLGLEFLSRAHLREPDIKTIQRIVEEDLFSEWPLPGREAMSEGLRYMQKFASAYSSEDLPALKEDFTRLFVGLEQTLAPPYSSVYLGKEGIMFDKETLKVREIYRRFGLELDMEDIVPDDHIGIELHFLSTLCREVAAAIESSDETQREFNREGIRSFLESHLLLWIDPLVNRISKNAATDFFRGIGYLTKGTVSILAEFLGIGPEPSTASDS